jgi:sugar (pentulose or hexulose) kinase
MKDVYFIGVDSGSQSTKVSIINQRGEIIAVATQPLRPRISRKLGWVEHPDDDLWDSLKIAVRKVMDQFHGNPRILWDLVYVQSAAAVYL